MDVKDLQNKFSQNKFFKNNGIVLKGVNLLRSKYVSLDELKDALQTNITETEFVDSINYLSESGYIKLRNIKSKITTYLSDTPLEEIEAKVSADGIKLVAGVKIDECIRV